MKTKCILRILVVLMIGLMWSISYGSNDFYYGSIHCLGHGTQYLPWQKDSLKFNISLSFDIDGSNIQHFVNNSMRAIPENEVEDISPYYWSKWSHYTLWEPERYEDSYYHLHYNGGTLVSDASASGGKAMLFSSPPLEPQIIIQTGPSYYQ